MNVFDLLPLEILKLILLQLDRKTIKYMYLIFDIVKKLNLQEILDLRAIMIYPRENGHCAAHYVPNIMLLCDNPTKSDMEKGVKYLHDIDADLVKGDLIIFNASNHIYREGSNSGKCIFDGHRAV